jgi:RNA polymerase sigma factor (sigma-70 family)
VINYYTSASYKVTHYDLNEADGTSTPDLSPEQQLLRQEQSQILLETLSVLSERDQEIMRLRFFGRLTNRNIAEVMELNERTVSVIILRALQKLKACLEKQEVL